MKTNLVQKDTKNRLPAGSDSDSTYYTREIDERGRIIFTPQVVVSKEVYDESLIVLNDDERDRFVTALMSPPVRNSAFTNAKAEFNKKYK